MNCAYCGDMMSETSPQDSYRLRREDSRFCNDECRMKYHAARRKYVRKIKMVAKLKAEIIHLKRELQYDDQPLPELEERFPEMREYLESLVKPHPIDNRIK